MKKVRALFESILYVLIGVIILRIGYYLYSYIIFDQFNLGLLKGADESISLQQQALDYIDYTAVFYVGLSWVVVFFLVILTIKLSKQPLMDKVYSLSSLSDVIMAVLAGLGTVLLTFAVINLSAEFFEFDYGIFREQIIYYDSVLITILAIGVIIPILEELFFRGIIFNRLSELKSGYGIVIISTVFFLVSHFNLVQSIYLIGLSLVASICVLRTRSVVPAIIVHMVFNAMNLVMNLYYNLNYQLGQLLLMALLGLVIIIFSIDRMRYRELRKNTR